MRNDHELSVKLVILDQDRNVLLQDSAEGLRLPSVAIPRFTRIAHAVTRAAEEQLGVRVWMILSAPLPSSESLPEENDDLTVVCRMQDPQRSHPALEVRSPSSVDLPEVDRASLEAAMTEFGNYDSGAYPSHFGRYSALEEVRAWYSPILQSFGLIEAEVHQWNGDPWFALFRIATRRIDPASKEPPIAFWFKAVGEPNLREYAVTEVLTEECPYWFAKVVALKPEWHGWLMEEVNGHELDEEPDGRPWALTARVLAKVQKRFVGQEERLLQLGCRDWRLPQVLASLDPFFEDMDEIMQRQASEPPHMLDHSELRTLKTRCQDLCRRIEDVDIPYTLAHGDFSPHNVIVSNGWPVFIDWAEAYVAFPFISWEYLWNRMVKDHPPYAEWHERMHRNYAYRVWAPLLGKTRVDEGLKLSPAMAVLNLALYGIDDPQQRQNRRADKSKRSLVRRLHRELEMLHDNILEPVGAL